MKTEQLTRMALMLALLIVCSQLSIPIGPVPLTLQTLAVLILSLLLSPGEAVGVCVTYMVMGLIGLPVFAGFSGGGHMILSPTFGFVIGFIPMAYIIAYFKNKPAGKNLPWAYTGGIALLGTGLLYAVGLTYMACILAYYLHNPMGIGQVLTVGMLPFIPGDILKIVVAIILARRLQKTNQLVSYIEE